MTMTDHDPIILGFVAGILTMLALELGGLLGGMILGFIVGAALAFVVFVLILTGGE